MIIEGYCNWHHLNKANHVGILLFKGKKDFKALTVFICVKIEKALAHVMLPSFVFTQPSHKFPKLTITKNKN